MKTTLSLFLYGILSASAAVSTPLNPQAHEIQLEATSSELVPRAASSVHLTMHASNGATYGIDIGINNGVIYSISKPSSSLHTARSQY